jgi:hypothetical protein
LFVEKCWSVYRIVKRFNALKVDGWEGWTDGGIKNLLRSASAVGVFIWNKTRREYDHEEEKWVKVKNPRKDWVVYHDPTLAIVPIGWFKEARKKLAATRRTSALTGRTMSRNERSATTLFSGTLFCASCNRELMLMRSAGKYKVMGCINGPAGKHGCQLTTTKSTRIIETCLLGYFQARLLTEDVVESLVSRANAFLAEEARKPLVSTAPLKASIREKERAIAKLFQRIEHQADKALAQAYEKRIADLQKGVNHLRDQLRAADAQNTPAPKPLDLAAVKALLPDLRAVLNQEIPAAAEAIRALTGQITVRQELIPGKTRGARWIATFSPDLLGWLRRAASDRDYPDSITLKYLCERNWITPEMVEVQLEHTPKYERLAQTIEEMVTRGAGVETVARALGVGWQTARESLEFARTGRRPVTKPSGKRGNRSGPPKFIAHAHEVVRLHDKEQLTFESIAKRLKISKGTVTRACDHVRPEAVRAAAESVPRPQRARFSRLGPSAYERVRDGLMAGSHPQDIAAEVGCGVSTVYRIRKEMRRDDEHRGIWGALI